MVEEPKLVQSYLIVRAHNPAQDVRLAIPPLVLAFVLGPQNPLELSDVQYNQWVIDEGGRVSLWPEQTERLRAIIKDVWGAGEFREC